MDDKNPNLYQTIAELRKKYPDDLRSIDMEQAKVRKLLLAKNFFDNEVTQDLISLCRSDILIAKKRLSSDKSLLGDEKAQRELWFLVESREWFLKLVVKDYDSELQTLQNELEAELSA